MITTPSLTVRVDRKSREAADIVGFDLVAVDGQALPAFSAGSHIDITLPNGITRQYSLCNSPAERWRYSIAVLREASSRGGSQALHDTVHQGDTLRISPPKNHFALAHGAMRHLLLAGGIGITPLLCMAERLTTTGEHFELHYCARSKERMAFRERVRLFSDRAFLHLDDGGEVQRLDLQSLRLHGVQAGARTACTTNSFPAALSTPKPMPSSKSDWRARVRSSSSRGIPRWQRLWLELASR